MGIETITQYFVDYGPIAIFVIVLSGVNNDLIAQRLQRGADDRRFDKLRTCAHNSENFHARSPLSANLDIAGIHVQRGEGQTVKFDR